jgi:hypothetical protein
MGKKSKGIGTTLITIGIVVIAYNLPVIILAFGVGIGTIGYFLRKGTNSN